jgi:hypothetical protein
MTHCVSLGGILGGSLGRILGGMSPIATTCFGARKGGPQDPPRTKVFGSQAASHRRCRQVRIDRCRAARKTPRAEQTLCRSQPPQGLKRSKSAMLTFKARSKILHPTQLESKQHRCRTRGRLGRGPRFSFSSASAIPSIAAARRRAGLTTPGGSTACNGPGLSRALSDRVVSIIGPSY